MRILPDTRDLINLTERGKPISTDEFRHYLLSGNHKAVLTLNNVRELAAPLAVGDGDFLRIRRYLQLLEAMPHTYLAEVKVVGIEIQAAVEAFTAGTEYKDVSPYVSRWDDTILTPSGNPAGHFKQLVGLRLDNIVYDVYRYHPQAFAPLHEGLPNLIKIFQQDRDLLRVGRVPGDEHFIRSIQRHAQYHRVQLPTGREEEFARWVYANPQRCPGLRLNHEMFREITRNYQDMPEVGDFVDLNFVFAVPYVEAITLDRRMREYYSRAARRLVRGGLSVDYRDRLYRDLPSLMQKNP